MFPRFTILTGDGGATANTRCAAALYALDVPLDLSRTATTITGDGINGVSVTWHFKESSLKRGSTAAMIKAWDSREHAAANPDCPIVNIKAAFVRSAELTRQAKQGTLDCKAPPPGACSTCSPQQAAAMEQLGHPIAGITLQDGRYFFHFAQAAAPDFALWDLPPGELEKRLPEALIAFLWCSFDNHRRMIDFIKREGPQFAAVSHRGKTAFISKTDSADQINKIEKILYRK